MPFMLLTNHTGPTCTGPVGLPVVLPMLTNQATSMATSVCNGSDMTGVWWCNNEVITVTTITAASVTAASWLYYNPTAQQQLWHEAALYTPPIPRKRIVPAVIRAGRRAARRSIDLYARFRGLDEIRRFVRGEPIVFEGEWFNYRVQKTIKILSHTMNPGSAHIPYSLRLIDRQTNKACAQGCVVFPSLPVIDQLLALTFHIEDDERKLIETTNWSPRLPHDWRERVRRPALQAAA